MKKLFTITTTIALILISTASAQAKVASEVLLTIVNLKTENKLAGYENNRVKTMCAEWPGCKEWVKERLAQDSSFMIKDAEVERRLDHWDGNEAIWFTTLYIQTREKSKINVPIPQPYRIITSNMDGSQLHAYQFETIQDDGKNYKKQHPKEIKKFPGHPLERPSEHSRYQTFVVNISLSKCNQWEQCRALLGKELSTVGKAVDGQYIHDFDEDGNALWARSLYVQFFYVTDTTKFFVFRAKQEKANGPYVYQPVKQISKCPNEPRFNFLK